jgi:hypothetical protein
MGGGATVELVCVQPLQGRGFFMPVAVVEQVILVSRAV